MSALVAATGLFVASASAAAPVDCQAFLVGSWYGEHTVEGVSSVTLAIDFGADGKFSAERTELKGTSSASDDQPVGTWVARSAQNPRSCWIDLTNGRSGETERQWIDVVGPNQYRTGHGDGDLLMDRKKP